MRLPHIYELVKRLLFVYLVYTLCRLVFFIVNYSLFKGYSGADLGRAFQYGLLFDTSAIVYTNALFIFMHCIPVPWRDKKVYRQVMKGLFVVVNGLAVLLNLIDTGYYPFSAKRSGMDLFASNKDMADQSVQYLKDYWFLAVLLIAFVWLMIRFYPKSVKTTAVPFSFKQLGLELLVLVLMAGLCFLGARGGWNLKPIGPFDAARFVKPELVGLTVNTPFQLLTSVQQVGVEEKHYMSDEEAGRLVNPVKQFDTGRPVTRKNVVLIIVESLGKEYVGYYNKGKGYTPFLDSLMQHSIVFENAYANSKRSITGLPAVIASMPSLMEDAYTASYYQANALKSLGGVLAGQGYTSSFFHGARNGSMSFDNFISISGGGAYYGLDQYPDKADFDGNWGIYDGPYLQYVAGMLNKMPQPFFSGIFTLSSHHPYKIPPGLEERYAPGTLPIHRTIRYTDDCLRNFFATASKMPWYKNTLFVITPDHSAENETKVYQSPEGMYRIPLLFFDPEKQEHVVIRKTVQQLDIMPGILWYLNDNKPFFSFGNNPFDSVDGYAVQYANNYYQIIRYPYILFMANDRPFAMANVEQDPTLKKNILSAEPKQAAVLEQQLKAMIQVYNRSLIRNKTTAE